MRDIAYTTGIDVVAHIGYGFVYVAMRGILGFRVMEGGEGCAAIERSD